MPSVPDASVTNSFFSRGVRSTTPRPKSRRGPQHRVVVREQPVQGIERGCGDGGVEAAPALVALQRIPVAEIEADAARLRQDLGQGSDIAEGEIDALPGNGMHAVGGIADDREASRDIALGEMHLERPALARASKREATQASADALLDLGEEARIVEGQDALGLGGILAPGDARAIAGQRQDGEGTARQKVLDGVAVVRLGVSDGGDDGGLIVLPAEGFDASGLARAERRPSAPTSSEATSGSRSRSETTMPASLHAMPVTSAGAMRG